MKSRIIKSVLVGMAVAVLGFSACPISPSFPSDAVLEDAGENDAGPDAGIDAGVDAGTTGSLGATLTVSDLPNSSSLSWNGSELATSTLDSSSQVTLRAIDDSTLDGYGAFTLQLANLSAGSTDFLFGEASYTPAMGGDLWSCTAADVGSTCTVLITITDFDGFEISGTFQITFGADADGNSAELSSGNFDVTFT